MFFYYGALIQMDAFCSVDIKSMNLEVATSTSVGNAFRHACTADKFHVSPTLPYIPVPTLCGTMNNDHCKSRNKRCSVV